MTQPASTQTPSARERAVQAHTETFGMAPTVVVRAPGRVNLIGEHTDYNDGFVLPMALPFDTVFALAIDVEAVDHSDTTVTIHSEGYGQASFTAGEAPESLPQWSRYVAGAGLVLAQDGHAVRGFRATIASDIPGGASLSSSAALEVAALHTFAHVNGIELDGVTIAQLGQRIENEVMGLSSGIMDQFISANAIAGHASLIDCRSLETSPVPVPATVVVLDTMTRRELVDSEYDLRRASCERAAAAIGVSHLRDATPAHLSLVNDDNDRKRAEHVITENKRTMIAAGEMAKGDAFRLGRLMDDSHRSLRDLYEVSAPALDTAVSIAQGIDGCLGARMTGGGFAGCAIALVQPDHVEAFVDSFAVEFERETGDAPRVWPIAEPADGAQVLPHP